jgi:hypothetical protein
MHRKLNLKNCFEEIQNNYRTMNSMNHRAIVNSLEKLGVEEGGDFIGYFKGELKREIIENPTEASLRDHESSSHIIQFTGNLTWRTLIEYLRFLKDETSSNLRGKDQIIRARTIMNDIDLPDMFNNERNLQVTQPVDPTIN